MKILILLISFFATLPISAQDDCSGFELQINFIAYSNDSTKTSKQKLDEAAQIVKEAFKNRKACVDTVILMNEINVKLLPEYAAMNFRILVEAMPENARLHCFLGEARHYIYVNIDEEGEEERLRIKNLALESYQKALDLGFEYKDEVYRGMSETYLDLDNPFKSIEYAEKALQSNPKNGEAVSCLVKSYIKLNNFTKANEVIDKSRNLEFTFPVNEDEFGLLKARIYAVNGNVKKAIEPYRKWLSKNPNDSKVLEEIAELCFSNGWYSEAQQYYISLIAEDPEEPMHHANLGWAKFYLKDNNSALQEAEQALELDEDYASALCLKGVVLADRVDEGALWYLQRAVEMNDEYLHGYFFLGIYYNLHRDKSSAMEQYTILKEKNSPLAPQLFNIIYPKKGKK